MSDFSVSVFITLCCFPVEGVAWSGSPVALFSTDMPGLLLEDPSYLNFRSFVAIYVDFQSLVYTWGLSVSRLGFPYSI